MTTPYKKMIGVIDDGNMHFARNFGFTAIGVESNNIVKNIFKEWNNQIVLSNKDLIRCIICDDSEDYIKFIETYKVPKYDHVPEAVIVIILNQYHNFNNKTIPLPDKICRNMGTILFEQSLNQGSEIVERFINTYIKTLFKPGLINIDPPDLFNQFNKTHFTVISDIMRITCNKINPNDLQRYFNKLSNTIKRDTSVPLLIYIESPEGFTISMYREIIDKLVDTQLHNPQCYLSISNEIDTIDIVAVISQYRLI